MTREALWFSNPNDAAAFLALLAIVPFLAVRLAGGRCWIPACLLALAPTVLLGLTASRGGLLALIGGLVVVAAGGWFGGWFTRLRVVAFALLPMSLAIVLILLPLGQRMAGLNAEDASVQRRWDVYCRIPAMLASAPFGWGFGNAGEAYRQWFEPGGVGSSIAYRNLLSSHATWIAEGGWLFTALYLCFWTAAAVLPLETIRISWRNPADAWLAWVSIAALGAAFLAASFSHVASRWEFWLALAVAAIPGIRESVRICGKHRRLPRLLSISALLALTVTGALLVAGAFTNTVPIHRDHKGSVTIGSGPSIANLATPDPLVIGPGWGHLLRSEARRHAATFHVLSSWPGTTSGCALVIAGRLPDDFFAQTENPPRKIVWLNPPPLRAVPPEVTSILRECEQVTLRWGARRTDASRRDWDKLAASSQAITLEKLPHAGRYLPSWVDEVTSTLQSPD